MRLLFFFLFPLFLVLLDRKPFTFRSVFGALRGWVVLVFFVFESWRLVFGAVLFNLRFTPHAYRSFLRSFLVAETVWRKKGNSDRFRGW